MKVFTYNKETYKKNKKRKGDFYYEDKLFRHCKRKRHR